ncbi:MAG TPA: alkaline phosphatase family protein [Terriglobales bacterium]|nr:alkaline phosphatase family protein [Terriglobales bacterium]
MKRLKAGLLAGIFALAAASAPHLYAGEHDRGRDNDHGIRHVLLISIDGMHALDFANCAKGISGINGGQPYCPNLAELSENGVNYIQASTTKPSDSFPGLLAQITGGTPRSTGVFYDVSYDRTLSPPAKDTPNGIPGGPCPGQIGTPVGYDESIGFDLTKLDDGGGIDPDFLPRDPRNNCAPVFPHQFLRVNTIFEVVRANGGYTAWTDKHLAYDIVRGPSGAGINDFYGPEVNSIPVPLPQIPGCSPLPDQAAATPDDDWTKSFKNIQCYDSLHVRAALNQIDGKTHDGSASAPVPNIFGFNFQAVSVGQKLVEKAIAQTGGYKDALGRPSDGLLSEIEFVDTSIGKLVAELKKQDLLNSTLIIISAKHGQSPIDPHSVLRIPADNPADSSPATVLGPLVAQSIEDDESLIWLTDQSKTESAVATLEANTAVTGSMEIFAGPYINLFFKPADQDSRTPDIIVTPKVGVTYTGGHKKIAEHGGFNQDDTHVMLLVSNPALSQITVISPVETTQIAPTILKSLGLDPRALQAVRKEGTQTLPGLVLPEGDLH